MTTESKQRNLSRLGLSTLMMVAAFAVVGCHDDRRSPTEPGSGTIVPSATLVTEVRDVQGFTGVSVDGAGFLVVEQTGRESLAVTAPDNVLPLLSSEVAGGVLYITAAPGLSYQGRLEDVTYRATLAELDLLQANGAVAVEALGISTPSLEVRGDGATSFWLSGVADLQDVRISGAGDYRAPDLHSRVAVIDLAGAAHAVVRVSDRLEVRLSGACMLEYYGDPVVQVTGEGTVRRLGP